MTGNNERKTHVWIKERHLGPNPRIKRRRWQHLVCRRRPPEFNVVFVSGQGQTCIDDQPFEIVDRVFAMSHALAH